MDLNAPLELHPDFDFNLDLDLLAYEQDDLFMPLDLGQFGITETTEGNERIGTRTSLACLQCRSRHVKCNAGYPSCSRCQSDRRTCTYIKSRRGAQRSKCPPKQAVENADWQRPDVLNHSPTRFANIAPTSFSTSTTPENSATLGDYNSSHDGGVYFSTQFIDLYYANFHDSHPILLPRNHFLARLQSNATSLQHVLPVIEFIGSLYLPETSSESLRENTSAALVTEKLPKSGFSVQALILFAVAMHCCNNFSECGVLVDRAIAMTLEIRMQSRCFAQENGENDAVLEESWRRTWWLLFVLDGTFACVTQSKTYQLLSIKSDVDLPCEEREYARGKIPVPKSLEQYDTREFAEEEIIFSSLAYVIDAARIIGDVLLTDNENVIPSDSVAKNADARIVNWTVHLPECKKEIFSKNHGMDEMIFQAHMLINLLKLRLHRPRSYLTYNCIEETSKCTPAPPVALKVMGTGQSVQAFHTHKALESLEALLGMMTLPAPILKHTPLIICGLALAIMGQISSCILVLEADKIPAARERIRLGIGALKMFTEVWPLAKKTISEMKTIARDLLDIRNTGDDGTGRSTIGMVLA